MGRDQRLIYDDERNNRPTALRITSKKPDHIADVRFSPLGSCLVLLDDRFLTVHAVKEFGKFMSHFKRSLGYDQIRFLTRGQ